MSRYTSLVLFLILFLILFSTAFLTGCSDSDTSSNLQTLMEEQPLVPQRSQNTEPAERSNTPELSVSEPAGSATPVDREESEDVDIDLTQLSVTMVSAQVLQIMMSPEDFLGQTVRVRGTYFTFLWEEADKQLHYVVLNLTAGCCGQGFEFILSDELASSVGYPANESVIEVTGIFSRYEELGSGFHYLAVYDMIVE